MASVTRHVFGNPAPCAPQVVIYGNCQVLPLASLLAAADDRYRYVCLLSFSPPGQPLLFPEAEDLDGSVLYLEQFHAKTDWLLPVRARIRRLISPECPRLSFPSFVCKSFWPFDVIDGGNRGEEGYPWGCYPYGDSIVLGMAKTKLSGGAGFKEYMRRARERMPDVAANFAQEGRRIRARDERCDVSIGDYVLDTYVRRHLFWTWGHVTADALEVLGGRLYAAAHRFLGGDRGAGERRLRDLARTLAPMGPLQVPIHPHVADVARLGFWRPTFRYRWYGNSWTFEEYVTRYLAYVTSLAPAHAALRTDFGR